MGNLTSRGDEHDESSDEDEDNDYDSVGIGRPAAPSAILPQQTMKPTRRLSLRSISSVSAQKSPPRLVAAVGRAKKTSRSTGKKRKAAETNGIAKGSGCDRGRSKKGKPVSWEERYNSLKDFKKKWGHTKVPSRGDFRPLFDWLYRSKRRKNGPYGGNLQLTLTQIRLLDELEIDWNVHGQGGPRRSWDASLAEVEEFYKANGHWNVPSTDKRLYNWLNKQKRRRLGECQPPLDADQIEKLKSVGLSWA